MHRNTYRRRENLILDANQRTPSTFGYQAGRDTYMKRRILYQRIMRRPFLSRKIRQENYHFFSVNSAHKNSRSTNVK
jgi:hypothetical protein